MVKNNEKKSKDKKSKDKKEESDNEEDAYDKDIEQLGQIEHVLTRPDTYIGSIEQVERKAYLLVNDKIVYTDITLPNALERIFIEILANGVDAIIEAYSKKIDDCKIEVEINKNKITVKSYGLPIPVTKGKINVGTEKKPIMEEMWKPEIALGNLRAGSNFKEKRHGSGKNGIGSKGTNIFSKWFQVIIGDSFNKKKYTQIWENNMKDVNKPDLEDYSKKYSFVEISFIIDLERFGYKNKLPDEALGLFARHVMDASLTLKIPTKFNDIEFNFKNIYNYGLYYCSEKVKYINHYQWDEDIEITEKKNYQESKDGFSLPKIEVCLLDTSYEGKIISFVNGINTPKRGTHVDAVIKAFLTPILKEINDEIKKKLDKTKSAENKSKRGYTITTNEALAHITFIINFNILNPTFESQSKQELLTDNKKLPKIILKEDELKPIKKWNLMKRIDEILDTKELSQLSNSNPKRTKKRVIIGDGKDANNANEKNNNCTLIVTEGKSGKGYADSYVGLFPQKEQDDIGVLPLRGKCLNDINAEINQRSTNKEFIALKGYIGLEDPKDGSKIDYSDDENFRKLRYKRLIIMADSDVDGKHIIGLILVFFNRRYPSLLQRGFVLFYRTPILRLIKGKQVKKFYTQYEFEKWTKKNSTAGWSAKYFKGLATSNKENIKEDYKDPKNVKLDYDDEANEAINVAFNGKLIKIRKKWLSEWSMMTSKDNADIISISEFINNELSQFSFANIIRSIPGMDGYKESQAKLIWGVIDEWNIHKLVNKDIDNKFKKMKSTKLAQLTAGIAKLTDYHHGEGILDGVFVNMVSDFVGSNNISIFKPDGQYGMRREGGKDRGAGRYLFTQPEPIFPYIFRLEDIPILEHNLDDEGKKIEPKLFLTVVPMALINGAHGVGSGWSTNIPKYNPIDIVNWLTNKLNGVSNTNKLIPWYKNFKGEIRMVIKEEEAKELAEADEEFEEEIKDEENSDNENENKVKEEITIKSFVSYGKFKIKKGDIIITELPIGKWTADYEKWLAKLLEEKKIDNFRSNFDTESDEIMIRIEGQKLVEDIDKITYKDLKLTKIYSLNNIVLLDSDHRPVRFETVEDYLEHFYYYRLKKYGKRKEYQINLLIETIKEKTLLLKFIIAVIVDETIIVYKDKKAVKRSLIYKQMDKLEIPHTIYDNIQLKKLDEDSITDLEKEIADLEEEKRILEETPVEKIWLRELKEFKEKYESLN